MYEARTLRRKILQILHREHPRWVRDEDLLVHLYDANLRVSAKDLSSELVYLRDWPERHDGYVELQAKLAPRTREEIFLARITPRGINLLEGLCGPDSTIAEV